MRKNHFFHLLLIIIFLTSCSNVLITDNDELLFNKIDELLEEIEEEQWEQAQSRIEEFENSYNERKWKMQLLGVVDDFKDIEGELEKVKVSVREEDDLEAKIGLYEIRHRMRMIYDL
ncbi:DUF4363 family protein [Evansella halocellulosilytica]|uniref:DUF4363 family protein n=1 Tax=Evansella halocellulosilytica TaxID=2011013 RepID=UPI000BB74641|nr:DUF4363 family protein [Evansella halocellulosilytica]